MENNKKLIDLGILQEDETTGVKKVSLVEDPAIMIDFMYFNKQARSFYVDNEGMEDFKEFLDANKDLMKKPGGGPAGEGGVDHGAQMAILEEKGINTEYPFGYCFQIAQFLFYALGGYDSDWDLMCIKKMEYKVDGHDFQSTHWYVQNQKDGRIVDLSAEQFEGILDIEEYYEDGRRANLGFPYYNVGDNKVEFEETVPSIMTLKLYNKWKEEHGELEGIEKYYQACKYEEYRMSMQFSEVELPYVEKFVTPRGGENEGDFIGRCMSSLQGEFPDQDQRLAVCYSYWRGDSFDFPKGTCWKGYEPIGTKPGKGGRRVPNCVPVKAEKFESYTDYPESATNAAKKALEWRDNHPDQDCGTQVGWARANQLAKREPISEETIARMASFARHLQYKDVPYSEGCGGLMVDAWGGQAGIEWASNKLEEIRTEMDIDTSGLTPYADPGTKRQKLITKAILMEEEDCNCPMDYGWMEDDYLVETILKLAEELGTKETDLAELFKKECFANPGLGGSGTSVASVADQGDKKLYLYKYEGPISTNSRPFCVGMVGLDNYYTKAQIQAMGDLAVNPGFGIDGASTYSIWSFKGGVACKHAWIQYLVTMPNGQIQIEQVKPAAGRAGRAPIDMPRQGRYSSAFKFASEDKQILVGPAMVPEINIPRLDDDGNTYFVKFSPETIKEIAMKYFKEKRTNDINTDHEENEAGAYIFESWIVEDPEHDKANTVYGYNVPAGTWMISVKVDDRETWRRVKAGELRGFSIEGILLDMEELEAKKRYEQIIKIMKNI